MKHLRGGYRPEARTLGKGARTLIGLTLTVLLLGLQSQFIAGADEGTEGSQTTEAAPTEAVALDTGTAEEAAPAEEPAPVEEPASDEQPQAEEPAPAEEPGEEPAVQGPPSPEPAPGQGTEDDASAEGGRGAKKASRTDGGRGRGGDVGVLTHVPPEESEGTNPQCEDFGLLEQTRFDPVPSSGSATQDGVTITITASESGEAVEFSWTSSTPIDLVIVKGGSTANLYFYDEETADTGLTAPGRKGISHISFCYDEEEPDVSVSKSASFEGEELVPGGSLTYTITVTNEGTGTATGVTLTDNLSDHLENVTATPSQGTCSVGAGNTLSCSLGDIGEGDSVTVTIEATVAEDFCGELTNQATVDAENDTNPDNNTSQTVRVTVVCQPDAEVEKTAVLEGNPEQGSSFDFSITVTNVGTGTVEDVVLTDAIQPGLSIVSVDPGPPTCLLGGESGDTVTCNLGDIAQGDSVTVTITVSVDEGFCGPIENTAEITSSNDSNPENDSDTVGDINVDCEPDVSVAKSASVDEVSSGGFFSYEITVTNEGTGTAENVTLTDDLDDNLTILLVTPEESCTVGAGNTLSCDLGNIDQGDSVTVTILVQVPSDFCGELINRATVDADNDSNPENNQTPIVTVEVPCGPDIDVQKTNDADVDGSFNDEEEALHEGDSVTFRVVITNTGRVTIQIDTLTDEFEETVIAPPCLTEEGENVIGMTLDPGDSVICFFTLDNYAPEPNGSIVDEVTVSGHDVENPETTVSDFDDSTVTTPEVLPRPPVRPRPPAPPGAPPPGGILAVTGAELALMALVALALVLAGIVLSYFGRREDETGI